MVYTKQTWADTSAGGTPVSAARLNYVENGVEGAARTATTTLDGNVVLATQTIMDAGTDTTKVPTVANVASYVSTHASIAGAIPVTLIDAKGDLLVGTANDTAARLGVGSAGYQLQADPVAAGGMSWQPSATSLFASLGDILAGTSTPGAPQAEPLGAQGQILSADTASSNGVTWVTPGVSPGTGTTKGDLLAYGTTKFNRVGIGTNGNVLTADSTQTSGIRWAQPAAVVDAEVASNLTITTVTTAPVGQVGTGMLTTVNPGETWWVEAELIYDATATAGISVRMSSVGSVATGGYCHGTMRGPSTVGGTDNNVAGRNVPIYYGTTVGGTQNVALSAGFGGIGMGNPISVSLNLKVKIGTSIAAGTSMEIQWGQKSADSAAGTMNLFAGSWAIFSKAGA